MKRIGKIALTLALIISLSSNMIVYAGAAESNTGVSADVKATLQEQLFFAYLDAENLGMDQSDFDRLYIGTPIYSYECVDGSLQEMEILTYPIFCDDEIVLFGIENTKEGEEFVQLSCGFAEELTDYYISEDEVALVYDDENSYVVLESGVEILFSDSTQVDFRDSLEECSRENIVLAELVPTEKIVYTGIKARASYAYLSIPKVLQGSYNLCWAASVASIGNYVMSKNYTAVDIAQMHFKDEEDFNYSLGLEAAMGVLDTIYDVNYYRNRTEPLSDEMIYYNLMEGYPVYAKWSVSDGSFHATVIRGILTGSYMNIMDPNTGFVVVYKSGDTYSYYYSEKGLTLTYVGYGARYQYEGQP